jgi:hypothetical protein
LRVIQGCGPLWTARVRSRLKCPMFVKGSPGGSRVLYSKCLQVECVCLLVRSARGTLIRILPHSFCFSRARSLSMNRSIIIAEAKKIKQRAWCESKGLNVPITDTNESHHALIAPESPPPVMEYFLMNSLSPARALNEFSLSCARAGAARSVCKSRKCQGTQYEEEDKCMCVCAVCKSRKCRVP